MELKERLTKETQNIQYKIDSLEKEKELILNEYANAFCPFKVGEIVTICGYFHPGKKGIVKWIGAYFYDRPYWKVRGVVLKKDGSVGHYRFEFTEREYERSVKEKENKVDMEKLTNKILENG